MRNFFSALRFLTVLPLGSPVIHDPRAMVPYFPVTGLLLGGVTAVFDSLVLHLWPVSAASLLDVVLLVLLTGAFHVDGLGDTADGLLGHRSREKVLAIMKDSRVGVMGLSAIVLGLLIKWAGIAGLSADRSLLIILVPAYARAGMIFGIRYLNYGRSKEGLGYGFFGNSLKISAFAWFSVPVFLSTLLGWKAVWLNFWFGVLVLSVLLYYKRRLGCITGDMLGAMTEVTESLLFLLLCAGGKV